MSDKTVELSKEVLMALLPDIFQERTSIADFNTFLQSGVYSWSSNALNRPAGMGDFGLLLMFRRSSEFAVQIAVSDRAGKLGYRCYWGSDGWHNWRIL